MKQRTIVFWATVVLTGSFLFAYPYLGIETPWEKANKPFYADVNAMILGEPGTLADVIEYADVIAVVKVNEIGEKTGSGSHVAQVTVEEALKGVQTGDDLIYYHDRSVINIEVGKEYFVCLSYFNNSAYPENACSTASHDAFFPLDKTRLYSPSQLGDRYLKEAGNTTEKLINYTVETLEALPAPIDDTAPVPDGFATVEEAYAYSDIVCKVTMAQVYQENEQIYITNFAVDHTLKGDPLDTQYSYILPTSQVLQEGESYYLFLKKQPDGSLFASAREGAVIDQSSPFWATLEDMAQ